MGSIYAKLKELIEEINVEYNKVEDIFDEHFEKEDRTKEDYYIQKEATSLMQELSWVKGKIETLLEEKDKSINKEAEILNTVDSITTDDLLNCWSGGVDEYNAIQELIKMYKENKQKYSRLEDEYYIQRYLINPSFMQDYIDRNKIREEIRRLDDEYDKAGEGNSNRKIFLYEKYALEKLLEKY